MLTRWTNTDFISRSHKYKDKKTHNIDFICHIDYYLNLFVLYT